ncbi:indole acetimide hydrolase [Burkholderia pseudomallei]|uniref:indoleacetamide hydrolase n=1 Tax=Burkholderia pseudomallei TaxID=28450 RepID=UPI0003D7D6B5|nr:indoleacetamide hydrolase [Burkholderia pseudomallei]AHE35740.1 mandelamide hydrolase [Burkholderia pseudomallei NAU20B-16]AHG36347.1 mandelamide hydrolase [Burkholderia pseudomallei MSHR511]AHG71766.1 mandelamide hydrolase [Burkholderia pseudomallei MSHR146]AIP19377.1 mandelamide hydrolase [Burkholderia pseudomallei MSHR5855]AIP42942.1 mandelamide hydrolase [Burkholderia pseudomallei MSHR5848]
MTSHRDTYVRSASVRAIADAVNGGRVRALEQAEAALERLALVEPLAAMTHVAPEIARRAAANVDAQIASGRRLPLAGVPFVIKDNLFTADMPTRAASPALLGFDATRNATAVQQLLDAGAVPLGKANMHELAFGITSANGYFGAVRNPHDLARIAGGSSGGTACAVAAGIAFGLGTDTGGSVRIPAAFCGVAGLRPTPRRYSTEGVLALSPTRDTVGPIAHGIDDLLLLDAVLTGDAGEPAPVALAGLRVGVPDAPYFDGLDPAVAELTERALAALTDAGARLIPLAAHALHEADEACGFPIAGFEALAYWRRFSAERLDLPFAEFVARLGSDDVRHLFRMLIDAPPSSDAYAAAIDVLQSTVRWYDQAFHRTGVDCIALPTVQCDAPLVIDSGHDLPSDAAYALFTRVIRQTGPATLGGMPSVSIPAGLSKHTGVPVGLMLEGPAGNDRRLLAIAREVERLLARAP